MHKKITLFLLAIGVLSLLISCNSNGSSPEEGQNLSVLKGCAACHSVDKSTKIGPPWRGLYGSQVELNDGSLVTADEAYLLESIKDPNAKIVKGFTRGAMPLVSLTDSEINSLIAYIKSVK